MTLPLPTDAKKPALDEDAFQQLLAAAYTLQEHNALRAANSSCDPAQILTEIASLRSQILAHNDAVNPAAIRDKNDRPRSPAEAAALVGECLRRLTKADGASVCLIVDGYLRPTACSGATVKLPGGSVASNSLVATERLRNGRAFQSANACSDIRLGPSLCVELQVGSLLAFPIDRQNEIAGLIEVRWTKANAFSEGDERICQLMAELMSEVVEAEDRRVNAQVPHTVQVTAPSGPIAETATPVAKFKTPDHELPSGPAIGDAQGSAPDPSCRVCGEPLNSALDFCGNCGMLSSSHDNGLQGKWASMWFMQQAQKTVESGESRSERFWPLHAGNSQNINAPGAVAQTESASDDIETDETGQTLSEEKRSPRGVLAVLKSRFRARAMGQ